MRKLNSVLVKMLYRYKVGIFSSILAAFTLFLVYITGPKGIKKPQIRVLYISYSDPSAVRRSLSDTPSLVFDDSLQILKSSETDNSVVIDRDEWDLDYESQSHSATFFQNNLVLECTASFPISWSYKGYGNPSVTEENVRIHRDFNDTNTFSYLSILNLMPLTEKTTGSFICAGVSNDTAKFLASVHLFVPGTITFLIDYDTTIESPGEDQIAVPCPVTNSSANITLYFKNQPLPSSDNLYEFDPKFGFFLKPKFVEEQSEPWGQFFCKNEESGEKSGVITIQPAKDLIVNAQPETNTVLLSKESSNENPDEKFKFVCQAKEEITLKFIKIQKNPMVQYEFNSSSNFPFSAYTEVNTRHFRNSSRIYCRTVRSNEDLHSWKVLFSSLSLRSELMDFHYDSTREDFSCCSPSNKKARLTYLPCNSISECKIKGHCLLPGHLCSPDTIAVLPERAGCVRYKLMQGQGDAPSDVSSRRGYGYGDRDRGRSASGSSGNDPGKAKDEEEDISLESGLLQCSIEGKDEERVFFAVKWNGENGSLLNTVTDHTSSSGVLKSTANMDDLKILELKEKRTVDRQRRRFICKGAKFFVAMGFVWQTVSTGHEIRYHAGRDVINGPWIKSQLDISTIQRNSRGSGSSKIKRIYCIAPLWNSENGGWLNVKLELE